MPPWSAMGMPSTHLILGRTLNLFATAFDVFAGPFDRVATGKKEGH